MMVLQTRELFLKREVNTEGYMTYAQTLDCPLKVKLKNSSKYKIDKIVIFGEEITNLSAGAESNLFCVERLFPSAKIDVTFNRRKRWGHIIKQPIDHVGESFLSSGTYQIVINIQWEKDRNHRV